MYKVTVFIFIFTLNIYCQKKISVHGVVSGQGVPLAGVNISNIESSQGIFTDDNGYYALKLSFADTLSIVFSYMGYQDSTVTIVSDENDFELNLELKPRTIQFSPLSVYGNSFSYLQDKYAPGITVLTPERISRMPGIGDEDIFRTLQTDPAVTTVSEISNQLYVRGGTPDQNLVLINGAPIYQPYHLLGLATAMNIDAIESVRFYKGGFSARYGDCLSSVIEITSEPGGSEAEYSISANLIDNKFTASGPVGSKIRYRLSWRSSFYDRIFPVFGVKFPYRFSDGQLKISYLPSPNRLVTLNIFGSNDLWWEKNHTDHWRWEEEVEDISTVQSDSNHYTINTDYDISWQNLLVSVQYLQRISSKLIWSSTLYQTLLRQNFKYAHEWRADQAASDYVRAMVDQLNVKQAQIKTSDAQPSLTDFGLRSDIEWNWHSDHHLSGGVYYYHKIFDYHWEISDFAKFNEYATIFMDFPPDTFHYDRQLNNLAVYLEDSYERNRFGLRCGGRWNSFDESHCDMRFSAFYQITPLSKITLAAGQFSQFTGTSIEYGFYSLAEIPLMVPDKPERAVHWLASYEYRLTDKLTLGFNAYSKKYQNLVYIDADGDIINSGQAYSRGLELDLNGYLGYKNFLSLNCAWNNTRKTTAGETFYPNYYQEFKGSALFSRQLNSKWMIDLVWNISSGRPSNLATCRVYTKVWSTSQVYEFEKPLPKNFFWYPTFHRLDLKLVRSFQRQKTSGKVYFQIINVYNRSNILYYSGYESYRVHTWYQYRLIKQNGFPFLPTIGIEWNL